MVFFLAGYNGTHPFEKPGQSYEDHSVMGMRAGCTLLGTTSSTFFSLSSPDD